ncbi:MAG: VOC family protein [Acidimicrobiia bacterium]
MINGTLYHLGVVTADLDAAMAHYRDLGVPEFVRMDTDYPARFRGRDIRIANRNAFGQWGDLVVEIVEPGRGDGPQREALSARGEGVFHVGYSTDDLVQRPLSAAACFEVLSDATGEPTGIVYLDTVAALGFFVELVPSTMATGIVQRVKEASR